MSWQDYVDNQLLASRCITQACIAGHDGTLWASSEGFAVSTEEVVNLITGFGDTNYLATHGITLAGQRYIYLSGNDIIVRAKFGRKGLHCVKTTQSVIVAIYEDPIQPQQAASVVEKLGDYLITCGF